MLVLSRKAGQSIVISGRITLTVNRIDGNRVALAFDAPRHVHIRREEFWRILRGCLESLPRRRADVFVLREMDDRNTAEICKELQITASNLWVILHRARMQLSNCMKGRWQQDQA